MKAHLPEPAARSDAPGAAAPQAAHLDPLALCNQAWELTAAAADALERDDMDRAAALLEQRRALVAGLDRWVHSPPGQSAAPATRQAVRDWVRRLLASDAALGKRLHQAVVAMRRERATLNTGRAALDGYGSPTRVRPEAEYVDRRR